VETCVVVEHGAGSVAGAPVLTAPIRRRRRFIALTLTLVLAVLVLMFFVFGPPSVAAAGGCGGG